MLFHAENMIQTIFFLHPKVGPGAHAPLCPPLVTPLATDFHHCFISSVFLSPASGVAGCEDWLAPSETFELWPSSSSFSFSSISSTTSSFDKMSMMSPSCLVLSATFSLDIVSSACELTQELKLYYNIWTCTIVNFSENTIQIEDVCEPFNPN